MVRSLTKEVKGCLWRVVCLSHVFQVRLELLILLLPLPEWIIGTSHHAWLEVSCNFIHCINNLALSKKKFILANLIGMSLLSATGHKKMTNMTGKIWLIVWLEFNLENEFNQPRQCNEDILRKKIWSLQLMWESWLPRLRVYCTHEYWKHNTFGCHGEKPTRSSTLGTLLDFVLQVPFLDWF